VSEVIKLFAQIKSHKKENKQKVSITQKETRLFVENKKTDQTHIVLGYKSESMYHKDISILKMIGSILGSGMSSRLFEKLREDMGVGYYVRAQNESDTDTGILQISCGVDSNRVEEVLAAIKDEVVRMCNELVDESELKKTKEYIIGNTYMGLEASDDIGYYYGSRDLFGLELLTPRQALKKIQEVTPKDIQRVARRIFKNDRLNIAMIGPHTDKNIQKFKKTAQL
jgi:predicted Zn-dependent peptidase